MPDNLGGVPTHPLIVHIPVVMVPLAALAVIAYFCIPAWRRPLAWVATALAGGGALGAVLAAATGESLQERVRNTPAIEDHAEMGETARLLAFLFFLVVLGLLLFQELRARRTRSRPADESLGGGALGKVVSHRMALPVIAVLLAVTGGAAVWSLVAAGHAGAKITWDKVDQRP
jgi:uncharacterized membrane protein